MSVLLSQHGVFAFASLGLRVVVPLVLLLVAVIEGNGSRRRYFDGVDELYTEGKASLKRYQVPTMTSSFQGLLISGRHVLRSDLPIYSFCSGPGTNEYTARKHDERNEVMDDGTENITSYYLYMQCQLLARYDEPTPSTKPLSRAVFNPIIQVHVFDNS